MSNVVFNLVSSGVEKAVTAEVLVSKKVASVKVDFDAGTVDVKYTDDAKREAKEAKRDSKDNPSESAVRGRKSRGEEKKSQEKPVVDENTDEAEEKEDADKAMAKNAHVDLSGDISTTDGAS